jgi:hypothetical protein
LALCGEIHSDQPQAYFELILGGGAAPPNLGDKEYRRLIKAAKGDLPALADAPRDVDAAIADKDDSSDGGFGFGRGAASVEPRAKRRRVDAPVKHRSDDEGRSMSESPRPRPKAKSLPRSPSVASSSSSGFGFGPRSLISEWHQLPGTTCFKLDQYKPKKKTHYVRWVAKCSHHAGCDRKKNAHPASVAGVSDRANKIKQLAYLAAWNEIGEGITREAHTKRDILVPPDLVTSWSARLEPHVGGLLKILDES